MEALKGPEYLRQKLNMKKPGVLRRYRFYEMKYDVPDFGISTPPRLRDLKSTLGWCSKAVDSLADRLMFYRFEEDNFLLNDIFSMNNPDIIFDSGIKAALISGCCFAYISPDADGYPRIQIMDGSCATGILDPITYLLKEGYAVLEADEYGNPISSAYFTTDYTEYYEQGKKPYRIKNPALYPLLVPIVNKPSARKPYGEAHISPACMSIVKQACRTLKRSDISSEFYSFPQKYVTGLAEDHEFFGDKYAAAMSAMLEFTKDEDGDHPIVGQFQQQTMSPHVEQLRMLASAFAGETGLTLDDLGFATENPSSAEAIKAAHESLRLTARKAQRTFGACFLNVGYVAASLRDNYPYKREAIYLTKPTWDPIFEPDSSALSGIGDGLIKINQAVPEYINESNMRELTGIRRAE